VKPRLPAAEGRSSHGGSRIGWLLKVRHHEIEGAFSPSNRRNAYLVLPIFRPIGRFVPHYRMRVRRAAWCRAGASSFQQREKDKAIIMRTNTPKKNRTDETTSEQTLIDGLNKHAAAIQAIAIAGASVTTKDIVATLQSRIDSAKAALSTRATWLTAVQADRAVRDKTKTFVSGLKQALLVAFAGQIDTLADFGLTGRKTTVLTPEEKLVRAAKARATRAARHTMGSKQKAEIKGMVAPTALASPAPSAPTPSPTPGGAGHACGTDARVTKKPKQ
jgi:hypothetical protein